MRRRKTYMRLFIAGIALVGSLAFADTITLKNGSVVKGTYLGGTARQVRVDDGSNVQTLDVDDIRRIDFDSPAPAPPPPPAQRPRILRPEADAAPPPSANETAGIMLPAGTNLVIRMVDAVDSERDRVGQ